MIIDPETYIFTFGKYKGKSYAEVCLCDPGYIIWCYLHVDGFDLERDDLEQLVQDQSPWVRRPYTHDDFGYQYDDNGNPFNL